MASLAVGTMNFGKRTNEAAACSIVDAAFERGLTHFDTANSYAEGAAELILGKALKQRRHQAHITTKVGALRGEGLSPDRVVSSLDESLVRLATDRVDAYLLHTPDPNTPLAHTLEGIARVLASGKALSWGVSNFAAWQISELNHLCDASGVARPQHAQVLYNLAVRQVEREFLPFARFATLTTSAYNPLAGGLFARPPSAAPNARIQNNALYRRRYGSAEMQGFALRLADIAHAAELSLLTLAYAWLLTRPHLSWVLLGPASASHLEPALAATKVTLSQDTLAALDALEVQRAGTDATYAR